jgi:capsule polysaccharide export protein KpsE/RkpR
MSRRYLSTRWAEDNCRPQCVACNIFNQGNAQAYRLALVKEIGEQRVNLIEARARQETCKYSEFELKTLIEHYKKEVERIAKEKGINL